MSKRNTYPGNCVVCGKRVEAGDGVLEKVDGKWEVAHDNDDDCDASEERDSFQRFDKGF